MKYRFSFLDCIRVLFYITCRRNHIKQQQNKVQKRSFKMQFSVMEMSINCFAAKYSFHEHVIQHAMLGRYIHIKMVNKWTRYFVHLKMNWKVKRQAFIFECFIFLAKMFLEKSIGILILNILCGEKAISTMYIAHISNKTELLLAFI